MLRCSVQKIKAMLLSIEYAMYFVETVDAKIKARNALSMLSCLSRLSIQRSKHEMH